MRDDKLIEAMARAMWDQRWKDLQSSPIRELMGANTREWECKDPDVQEEFRKQARAALAALQETHAVVPREPVAWRRPSISRRNRWVFAYAREAAHFNQGEWEPLYAAAPQPHAPVAIKELRARRGG